MDTFIELIGKLRLKEEKWFVHVTLDEVTQPETSSRSQGKILYLFGLSQEEMLLRSALLQCSLSADAAIWFTLALPSHQVNYPTVC